MCSLLVSFALLQDLIQIGDENLLPSSKVEVIPYEKFWKLFIVTLASKLWLMSSILHTRSPSLLYFCRPSSRKKLTFSYGLG